MSGLYGFLLARSDVMVNPVPRGLPTRRERQRPGQGVPLVRVPRTLPRILGPAEVDALTAALRTHRDRAMAAAMVLGGLRRCEVLGLRLGDLRFAERRLFIAEGKGGHQRLIPVSARFFTEVSAYLDAERPADAGTDRVFVVLKGPRRGLPLSAAGLDEVLDGARGRAGLAHATCHQLRHTCLTRLRKAGMSLEAVQAQAGHASIESTRIYLHLGDDWLASQYRFTARKVNKKWFGDGTGIVTGQGKLYLASVLDIGSRRILGFALSGHHDAGLAYGALAMAAAVRGGHVAGVIMHTGQGSEYTAGLFRQACGRLGIRQSMGRPGPALDNAAIESFHSTLEWELRSLEDFATRSRARTRVAAWIDEYNTIRRHSSIGMTSPAAWEASQDPGRAA